MRSENEQVVAAILQADDDGIGRQPQQLDTRSKSALAVRLEDEHFLAPADEHAPRAVHLVLYSVSFGSGSEADRYSLFVHKRSELAITDTDDKLMAAPARIGLNAPTAASGMLSVL